MKKSIFKITFATACLLGMQSMTSSSQLMAENIPLTNDENYQIPDKHRSPALDLTPIVEINDAGTQLSFTGQATITFSVEIEDEDENTVLTDVLAVQENDMVTLSISSLPAGNYTLYVTIGDARYVGEFSK